MRMPASPQHPLLLHVCCFASCCAEKWDLIPGGLCWQSLVWLGGKECWQWGKSGRRRRWDGTAQALHRGFPKRLWVGCDCQTPCARSGEGCAAASLLTELLSDPTPQSEQSSLFSCRKSFISSSCQLFLLLGKRDFIFFCIALHASLLCLFVSFSLSPISTPVLPIFPNPALHKKMTEFFSDISQKSYALHLSSHSTALLCCWWFSALGRL